MPGEESPLPTLRPVILLSLLCLLVPVWVVAQEAPAAAADAPTKAADAPAKAHADPLAATTLAGLEFRSIGPAMISGRIVAIAVEPGHRSHYYGGAASGGVWKTINDGNTWTPVFEHEGSYSIGTVVLDPRNPSVVWVGTGESNSQRSVGYGDGIYRSEDGGKTWKNMGLKTSQHIARIVIDPTHTDTVYVAAQGSLWGPGGDRGVFKTTDGGKTWSHVLAVSANTGATELVMDPRDPQVLYAASYQRRRHVWTLIDGGPESALYKTTDGGATWSKLTSGLPKVDMGRIGLAISPVDPDVLYATIEAADHKGGIFRSTDRGATWEKRNGFDVGAMYYGQIFADPRNQDRIYVMNVRMQVSDDGGKTVHPLGERSKHSDNHVIWIDPADPSYYLVGCDGGVYESFDRGATWGFKNNLPLGQFYDVAVDHAAPFYDVYGGTQDNSSVGGPSRTRNVAGITNADWFITQGGDGFRSQVDPDDPNTVYAELQNGVLARFNRSTGEHVGIQPQVGVGEPPLRWNWDSPLLVSPHSHTRLYFAANKLFRSDDRGDSWKAISGDLTRQLDRDQLKVMGRVWGPDAVAKNASTSFYGNLVALTESPLQEGLIYVGSDDGLVQVTRDGGVHWARYDAFPGVPANTYVSRLAASAHDRDTVYAAFDNHKNNDFKPYLLKSGDNGKSWTSIAGNLPPDGPVLAFVEDTVNPRLLFAGTEFGLFATFDGGQHWVALKGGLPTIPVRDLVIQPQMNDLVVATFGRGFYILDDMTPLRTIAADQAAATLFTPRDGLLYTPLAPYGGRGKSFQGEAFFTAPNPPAGVTFTYYLRDSYRTAHALRLEREAEAVKKNADFAPSPTPEELRRSEEAEAPTMVLTVRDASGEAVRLLSAVPDAGLHRLSWDLRGPAPRLVNPAAPKQPGDDEGGPPSGPLLMPGKYSATLSVHTDGGWKPLAGPAAFQVVAFNSAAVAAEDRAPLAAFQQKASRLQRALYGAVGTAHELKTRLAAMQRALLQTPGADPGLADQLQALTRRNAAMLRALEGDPTLDAFNVNQPPALLERGETIADDERLATGAPTGTDRESYTVAAAQFSEQLGRLRVLAETDVPRIEKVLEMDGAPWTPGRLPVWSEK